MPEGLDPIETGKKLHEHAEGSAEHSEGDGGHGGESGDRHSRIAQICEAVLLALVTITAALAGYSAARWNTASRVDIAQSSTLRNLATREDLTAISLRNFDASTFNAWFIAFTLNNPQKEQVAVRRFRPAFRIAFSAWLATNPLRNPSALSGSTGLVLERMLRSASRHREPGVGPGRAGHEDDRREAGTWQAHGRLDPRIA